MALVSLHDVTAGYGGAPILRGVNISIEADEVGVIVGPNGAGKSTALKSIFGLLKVSEGSIIFDGDDITNRSPDSLVPLGLSFVPQEHNVFTSLSVNENLEMGAFTRDDDFSDTMMHVYDMFPDLKLKRHQKAGELSGGQRQMVAMGRALMLEPELLLLDEPTAGLSPKFMAQIFAIVRDINALGVSILMVEQNAKQALGLAHRAYVLAMGQNRYSDSGANLLADPAVAKMFLGG